MRLLAIILAMLLTTLPSSMAQRQRTTIKGKLQLNEAELNEEEYDTNTTVTITAPEHAVRLSGYDKPRNATRETMHVTNQLKSFTIKDITLEISYIDSKNRELHHRTETISMDIEPGHTQLISFPTWDRQHSFYYKLSAKPRAQATPYDINCRILTITLQRTTVQD